MSICTNTLALLVTLRWCLTICHRQFPCQLHRMTPIPAMVGNCQIFGYTSCYPMYKCLSLLWWNQDILLRDSVLPMQLNETQLHGEYELSKTNKYAKSLNKYTLQCTQAERKAWIKPCDMLPLRFTSPKKAMQEINVQKTNLKYTAAGKNMNITVSIKACTWTNNFILVPWCALEYMKFNYTGKAMKPNHTVEHSSDITPKALSTAF